MRGVVLFIFMLLIFEINAVSIQFFTNRDLTGLVLESNSTANCNNILHGGKRLANVYVKTDICLMVYRHPNCQSTDSKKILPDMPSDNQYWVESFHICNENEGGSTLNIDITKYYDNPSVAPQVLHSFRKVCSCINIPTRTVEMDQWSINNHGNDVLAYYEADCKQIESTSMLIVAGNNGVSRRNSLLRALQALGNTKNLKIKSLGPNPDSSYFKTTCNPNLALLDESVNYFNQISETDKQFQLDYSSDQGNAELEFFSRPRFSGFLFESEANANCNNLPKPSDPNYVADKIASVKTNKCVIIFSEYDCGGHSTKIGSPGISDLERFWGSEIKSFYLCTNLVGSSHLNFDITKYGIPTANENPPAVLQSYRNICNCKTVPKFIQNKNKWSINNYANSLVAYFDPNCLSTDLKPIWIPAGYSIWSEDIGVFGRKENYTGIIQRVQAIGPDPNSQYFKKNCIKLDSTIFKFEIIEPSSNITEQNMEMTASKTVFRNNGPGELSQTYSASKSVHEVFKIEIGNSLSNMNRVQVDTTFDVETKKGVSTTATNTVQTSQGWENSHSKETNNTKSWNAGGKASFSMFGFSIGGGGGKKSTTSESDRHTNTLSGSSIQGFERSNSIFQEESFKQGLRNAYEMSGTRSTSSGATATVEKSKTFSVSQVISVPACTEHVVNAYVKVVTNKRVEYQVLAKIKGKIGGKSMTSAEVRMFLDSSLVYVEDYDDTTVLAYSSGSFRAEYGISSYINSDGSTLHDCMARISTREKSCPKFDCSQCTTSKSSTYSHPFMSYAGMI